MCGIYRDSGFTEDPSVSFPPPGVRSRRTGDVGPLSVGLKLSPFLSLTPERKRNFLCDSERKTRLLERYRDEKSVTCSSILIRIYE